MEYLQFAFKSLGHFIGVAIILSMVLTFLFRCWNRLWRHANIRKHGYPPQHCDADGDFKKDEEEN